MHVCKSERPKIKDLSLRADKGFTLIELSIVIVIIGLIVAGVVGGQALVKQSKIRGVISDIEKYRVAINAFKLEYDALPGDMLNAQSYWGAATVTNGNGDDRICDNVICASINQTEKMAAWEHLALAGLIQGSYSGTGLASIGVNVPKTTYSNDTTFYFYYGNLWNAYNFGGSLVLSGTLQTGGPSMAGWSDYKVKVRDAYNIDLKTDDGKPYLGSVITYSDVNGNCVPLGQRLSTGPVLNNVDYQITNVTDLCTMQFGINYNFK